MLLAFANWKAWATYVKSGERPVPPVSPRFNQPGPYAVLLTDVGECRIEVIKAIREVTGLGLVPAKELTEQVPASVASGLSPASAQAVANHLATAGASTEIRPPIEG